MVDADCLLLFDCSVWSWSESYFVPFAFSSCLRVLRSQRRITIKKDKMKIRS